jgi:hypothetical protein
VCCSLDRAITRRIGTVNPSLDAITNALRVGDHLVVPVGLSLRSTAMPDTDEEDPVKATEQMDALVIIGAALTGQC